MKSFYIFLLAGCILSMITSCGKDLPLFTELKSDENKLISKILAEKGIEVLKEYPSDGIFEEHQFVQLDGGVYLNVVDSGNGNRAELNNTRILLRFDSEIYLSADSSVERSFYANNTVPFEFKYGMALNIVNQYKDDYTSNYYYYFSSGLELPLSYVGENAVVRLLIPGYATGEDGYYPESSTFQRANRECFYPIYYDKLKYTFY